ncbi:TonB-dependent receptor [Colwellia sp. MB02u-18]|uniref:TonB-dependent receptor n=1 Tax=unclassified Colwellia TaxID=196834 RepID=UPI0015F3D99F|nr:MULTISPECIES: TonB-dependent receptor [unclassified Colwellia]MBA6225031.1 TonB-dependent receptor [Colwellia sp. MB3u-45]MBA6268681.1 TonB-dependent receptor [Colwellia sp. MB3u-43]MBA6321112.1 TonB-dependent receptor [Colwellia sp. MB02u-19]MBA6325665.1 TonB-dependent receptor [Colwellia sp. MB02u-18]MBA6332140.1 TonB-dependent receptor [Colwellia sp. MB02u-12]
MYQINRPAKTALTMAIALALSNGTVQAQENSTVEDKKVETERQVETIVVTSTRRAENQQTVPLAVQAMSGAKLQELGIDSFEDYIALLPGVSSEGQGPGKQETYIRGVSAGRSDVRLAGIGGEPSVAFYLDEAPITTPGRNIDLYAVDLQRIEVLKGPQGTLFGASSQAGTVRLITNKPVLDEFRAGGEVGMSSTKSGGISNKTEGYLNIPIVDDTFALRIAAYNSTDAGFIDNALSTTQLPLTNPGLGGGVPSSRQVVSNATLAKDDYNEATHRGMRVSALWQIDNDWDLLIQHTNQQLDTEGSFEYDPSISTEDDLNASTFSPTEGDDKVDLTQWTLNGMLGGLEVIYNGSFTNRTFQGNTDYTAYIEIGPYVPYYTCSYPGYDECFSPVMTTSEQFETERVVHEIRVATNAEDRFRAIGGVFYDDQQLNTLTDFNYAGSIAAGFSPNFPIPGAFTNTDGSARPPGVTYFNDYQTDREELSVFGELAYDVTDDVTVTVGARHYEIEMGLMGHSSNGQRASGPEAANGTNVDSRLAGLTPATISGTIYKANIRWKMNADAMFYGTYSEGFRGGGFNRSAGTGGIPATFDTDTVVSVEFGWKTAWLDNTLRFNGAIYHVDFSDMQQGVLDLSIANNSFFDNVGSSEINGLEFELNWAATENVDLFGSLSYIDSELTDIPNTLVNITPVGSNLPYAPESEGVIGGRYYQEIGDFSAVFQGVFKWTDSRFNSLVDADRVELPSYTQVNLSASIGKDDWKATLFVDNATDSLGQVAAGSADNVYRVSPTRPRTIGFRISYDY